MTSDALITALNFKPVHQSLLDQKQGLAIEFGYLIGLPAAYKACERYFGGLGFALTDKGYDRAQLDKECAGLMDYARIEKIDFLATKSNFEFDPHWYWLGDFRRLFDLAEKRKIHLPISDYLYDNILESLESYKG